MYVSGYKASCFCFRTQYFSNPRYKLFHSFLSKFFNLLCHKPLLGSSNSVANTDMMSEILTNGIQFSD